MTTQPPAEDERVAVWWDGLSAAQQAEVRGLLDEPLPDHVVSALLAARIVVTGAVGRGGMTYRLPPAVRAHIENSAITPLET